MKRIPAYIPVLTGVALVFGGCAYGVTHAFPNPDATDEMVLEFYSVWNIASAIMKIGAVALLFGTVLALFRGDPK